MYLLKDKLQRLQLLVFSQEILLLEQQAFW
jgi:hypothetical protein